MPMRFLRPMSKPGQTGSSIRTTTGMSPLQKITQQYRDRQTAVASQTSQKITELSKQRERLTVATEAAVRANDTPLDGYLRKSGQMVGQRIGSLQAKINGKTNAT